MSGIHSTDWMHSCDDTHSPCESECHAPVDGAGRTRPAHLANKETANVECERFFVTGAAQDRLYSRAEVKALSERERLEEVYARAVIAEVDFARKRIVRRFDIERNSIDFPVDGYSTNFTAPARMGDTALIPSSGMIYEFDLNSFSVTNRITCTLFNDLHHVTVHSDRIYATSTGIDHVVVLDLDTRSVVEALPVLAGVRPLEATIDYRTINTKPHRSHPNFVFFAGGKPWVTRARQYDCTPLDDHEAAIPLSDVMVHDGVVHGDHCYFTSVRGEVIRVDPINRRIVERLDLMKGRWHLLAGWCRALHVTPKHYYVGFSVFRRTKRVENIAWIKAKLTGKIPPLPTRIEKIDRSTGRVVDEMIFDPLDLNAIFWLDPVET